MKSIFITPPSEIVLELHIKILPLSIPNLSVVFIVFTTMISIFKRKISKKIRKNPLRVPYAQSYIDNVLYAIYNNKLLKIKLKIC